jgi:DNA polymerase-3 subunit alpha
MPTMSKQHPYIPLHVHTHYSLLEGLTKIKPLVERAKKNKMEAVAMTDNGNMYGAIEFYKTCEANDIKPIIGIDAYITPGKYTDKVAGVDNVRYRLTLLAETVEGYKNLMRLTSIAYTEGFYYKPRIDKDLLRTHKEGIICLCGGFGSEINRNFRDGDSTRATEAAKEYLDIFGKEHFFIEVQHTPNLEYAEQTRAFLIDLGKKTRHTDCCHQRFFLPRPRRCCGTRCAFSHRSGCRHSQR